MSAKPKVSVACLAADNGPEVGIWIRNHDEQGEQLHLDLTIQTARALAQKLSRAADEAERWLERNRRYVEVD